MPGIETTEFLLSKIDDFGTPNAYNHYAVGWAHAMCTPYQWTKQVASHWGGTRNGTIVHWPNGFADKGKTRNQFHHVIDVAPTILEAAGLPAPISVNGIAAGAAGGRQHAGHPARRRRARDTPRPVLRDVRQPRHLPQGLDGGDQTQHAVDGRPPPPFDDDVWELYGPDDWTQAHNLAAENPEKLAELQRLWLIEAVKYNVVPLDDRRVERFNPDIAGRPAADPRQQPAALPGDADQRKLRPQLKNKSHTVTADITVPEAGAAGVIVTQGGSVGRLDAIRPRGPAQVLLQLLWHPALHDHRRGAHPGGKHQVRMEFKYDGGGLAKGGDVTLYYDGKAVGTGRVEQTQPMGSPPTRPATSAPTPARPPPRITVPPATSSPARSTGCRSTSATTAKTTSSKPRTGSPSRWPDNRRRGGNCLVVNSFLNCCVPSK